MSGWQRLWTLLAAIWLVVVGIFSGGAGGGDGWAIFLGLGIFPILLIGGLGWVVKGFLGKTKRRQAHSTPIHDSIRDQPADLLHAKGASEKTRLREISQQSLARQPNFILKHWRGDYSLGFSYWVIGSLLTVVVLIATNAVGSFDRLRELGPRGSGFVILTFFGFLLALTLWQLVGIWRSASKHKQRGGKAFWAGLAKVMVVLGLFRAVIELGTQGVPVIVEGAKLLVGIDNTPAHEIRLLRDGTELELAGGMPFGTTDAISTFLDAAPTIQVIHMNSQGGRMNEAYQLYKLIKERRLITYTSADCLSACAIAFLAGRERYLGERGRLGFHSASIGQLSGEVAQELNNDVRQTLRTHGVPDAFIARALSTSPSDMWYPTSEELISANVVDSVVDSRYFGLSGISNWRDTHKVESVLLATPIYAALARYDHENYAKLRDIMIKAVQAGHSQKDIESSIRAVFLSDIIPTYLRKAPDEALTRYWRIQIAEMKHLATISPQHCADFIFPRFAKSPLDLQRLLPKTLQNEDLNALVDIVNGVAMNPKGHESTPRIQADLEKVVINVGRKYPWALDVIQNPSNYKNDPKSLCGAITALYAEVLAIPDSRRSGAMLRYLASD